MNCSEPEPFCPAPHFGLIFLQHGFVIPDTHHVLQRLEVDGFIFLHPVGTELIGGQDIILTRELILQLRQVLYAGFDSGWTAKEADESGGHLEIPGPSARRNPLCISARFLENHGPSEPMVYPVAGGMNIEFTFDLNGLAVHAQKGRRNVLCCPG